LPKDLIIYSSDAFEPCKKRF